MSTPTLPQALDEIEKTQRNTQRLIEAGKLTAPVGAWKLACLARAHKALTFLAANEGWIVPIYKTREEMAREAERLCADPMFAEALAEFDGATITVRSGDAEGSFTPGTGTAA